MAGRGVDIQLGEGVTGLGGLYVIGTERHEARRIDNQLRGRSGRQGDPGETRFYLSGEDDLVRLFAGDRIKREMEISRRPATRRADSAPRSSPPDRGRAEEGRGDELRLPQARAQVRRGDEQAAPGDLRAAPARARAARISRTRSRAGSPRRSIRPSRASPRASSRRSGTWPGSAAPCRRSTARRSPPRS